MISYWLQWIGAPIIMLVVSLVYFLAEPRRQAIGARLLVSAHGLIGAVLYLAANFIDLASSGGYRPELSAP